DAPVELPIRGWPLRFELTDGSLFGGRVGSATERGFAVRFLIDQVCRLEPMLLRTICSTWASAAAQAKLLAIVSEFDRSEDVAVVERGSKVIVLRGAVRNVDAERVLFVWKQRELQLPWERLAGLVFARPTPRQSSCTVHLRGGDVFCGRVIAGDDTSITLRSAVFERLELEWSRIERIECRSQRLTFLSDLVPQRYEFTPFFQKQWDYARDRTLTGRPIRISGEPRPKGVTMHSRSALAYTLEGQYRQFAAAVGIVDEMAERGDVTLAVLGDGRILWQAANVRGGEPPREVLVDVTGVRELSLHVDFGEGLDLSDHVCWAEARLIR
ncbi:MAG: NPCBM/NEW2 domain-containing protein, partial [Planctomycetes bacterium]|nr:NPCBM/NEW2 domain-containing protein [Planctomycetota bacterium]